jgi:SAM-dependent methyltransferase
MKSYLSVFLLLFVLQSAVLSQDVPYVPTTPEVVNGMLKLAEVTEDDLVYDLGCGDGRIVVAAARDFGAKGVGVDSNPDRIKESNDNAEKNDVKDKVKFIEQNLFEADIKDATVVAIYLLNSVNLKLRPKLFRELQPGTRVVSHAFHMEDWAPDSSQVVDDRDIYFWIIPENASGTWNIKGSDRNFSLNIDQRFQEISGTLTEGEKSYEIKNAKIEGSKLSFTAEGDNSSISFEGEVNDDTLQGTINSGNNAQEQSITAVREDGTKKQIDPALAEIR